MTSQLNVTDINGLDADAGRAKAWANLDGAGTVSLRGSFNISSVTDEGTGNHTLAFTNAMASTGYAVIPGNANSSPIDAFRTDVVQAVPVDASSINMNVYNSGGQQDNAYLMPAVFGELA